MRSLKARFDKSRRGNAYVQETGSRRRANHFFQLSYNRVPFTLPDKPVPDVRPYPPFGVCATDSRRAINSA
jgi:hypothetical protein